MYEIAKRIIEIKNEKKLSREAHFYLVSEVGVDSPVFGLQ